MAAQGSPEQWEAQDHIEALKRGLNQDTTCPYHDDSTRAQIWQIRHQDMTYKAVTNGNGKMPHSWKEWWWQFSIRFPYAAIGMGVMVTVILLLYYHVTGTLPFVQKPEEAINEATAVERTVGELAVNDGLRYE